MNWPIVEIQEICRTGSGTTPSRKNADFYFGHIPWVKSGELRETEIFETEEHVTDKALSETSLKLVPPGALLVAMYGATVGRVGLLGVEATTNQAVCHVVPDKECADTKYLFHLLQTKATELVSRGVGGAQPNIRPGISKRPKIPLPPRAEPTRLAGIRHPAPELGRLRTRALDKLSILGQAIFHEMFGDPVDNPKGFPRKKLLEIVDIIGGSQPAKKHFLYDDGPGRVRFVQTRDFRTDAYKTYVPEDLAKRPFSEDDVIIGRYGPPVFQIFRGLAGTYNVALMKAQPIGEITKDFVFHLLQEPKLHGYVVANSERTAGQSGVNLDLLKDYPVYAPPIELQTDFSQRLTEVDTVTRNARRQNLEAQTLFASLQHRAFRGEL